MYTFPAAFVSSLDSVSLLLASLSFPCQFASHDDDDDDDRSINNNNDTTDKDLYLDNETREEKQ